MRDLAKFGTHAYPLHPSGLRTLLVCPWSSALRYLAEPEDEEGGEAADTGSAVHAAVAELHRGKQAAACLESMSGGRSGYPRADLQDAAALFLAYAADPRNASADVVLVEERIAFQISPAPDDPTQAPVQVIGTLDQVRRDSSGRLTLWDVKTSRKDSLHILHASTFQAAAYCVGATLRLGATVHPGGVVLPRRYPRNAHWAFAWKFDDIEQILVAVRAAVARVRAGQLYHVPNDGCQWCIARSPDLCLPKLQETVRGLRRVPGES